MTALAPHLVAGAVALWYAWQVAQTPLRTSGLQFISPLIAIILVHLGWAALRRDLRPGFAADLMGRSAGTSAVIVVLLVLGTAFAPMPAQASDLGEIASTIAVVVFCAVIIFVIIAVLALFLRILVKLSGWLFGSRKDDDGPSTRMYDFGGVVAVCATLGLASLEGMPHGFDFDGQGVATTSRFVDVPPDRLWEAMQVATSPGFPLPGILAGFPRPVAVTTDEGVGLGANRVVRFEGREGAGRLHLQVTGRTATMAHFTVLSDTTPYAGWIGYKTLTYEIVPDGTGSRLTVTLAFERKLAPAMAFGPLMRGAAYLAADVLARDVKARAEGG